MITALTRAPGPELPRCVLTHLARLPPDTFLEGGDVLRVRRDNTPVKCRMKRPNALFRESCP